MLLEKPGKCGGISEKDECPSSLQDVEQRSTRSTFGTREQFPCERKIGGAQRGGKEGLSLVKKARQAIKIQRWGKRRKLNGV